MDENHEYQSNKDHEETNVYAIIRLMIAIIALDNQISIYRNSVYLGHLFIKDVMTSNKMSWIVPDEKTCIMPNFKGT